MCNRATVERNVADNPGALAGASGALASERPLFSQFSALRARPDDIPIGGLAGDATAGIDVAAFLRSARIGDGLQTISAPIAVCRPIVFSATDMLTIQRAQSEADFTILRGHFDFIGLLNLGRAR